MQKEEVIKKIDELSVLLLQMKKILRDYEDIIYKYSDNDLKYYYNDCEYWENILANSRQNILNHWGESENTDFDNEITETLRLAGVQLDEHWDDPRPVDKSNPVGRIYSNNMGDKYYVSYFYKGDWSGDTEITLVSEANTENFYDMTEFEEFLSDMDLKFIGYVKNYGEIPGEYTLDPQ